MYIEKLGTLMSQKMKRRQRISALHTVETQINNQKFRTQTDLILLASVKASIKELASEQVKNRKKKNAIVSAMRSGVDIKFFGRKYIKMNPSSHGKKALFQRYVVAVDKKNFFKNEEKRISKGSMTYASLSQSEKRQVRKERNYLEKLKEIHTTAI